MTERSWTSLAEHVAQAAARAERPLPGWVHPVPAPVGLPPVGGALEGLLQTLVASWRAEELEQGVWVSPRTLPEVYDDLLAGSRTLDLPVPEAVVGPVGTRGQAVVGTDARPVLHLSSGFLTMADPPERRVVLGRLLGQIAARQVTARTWMTLADPGARLRQVAGRTLGPAVELVMSPLSVAVRAALSRWHRAAELTADRAGLIVAGDLEATRRTLVWLALGSPVAVRSEAVAEEGARHARQQGAARWAESLADEPFLHTRLTALERFAASSLWVAPGSVDVGTVWTPEQLAEAVDGLLRGTT